MSKAHTEAQQIWERFVLADTQLALVGAGQGAHGDVQIEHVDRELLGALATLPDAEPRVEVEQLRGEWAAFDAVVFDGSALTMTMRASARRARPQEIAAATRYGASSAIIAMRSGELCPA